MIYFGAVALVLLAVSCTPSSNYNTGVPSQPLMPLASGDQWIYLDSVFNNDNGGALDTIYIDTMVINSQTLAYNGPNGNITFYGVTDPNGWWGDTSYIGLDPSNTVLYGVDGQSGSPYAFFGTSSADGVVLGQSTDYTTNPNCPTQYSLIGYATPVKVGSYTCLWNQQNAVNCNNFTVETINTYVDPGVGVVRIVDFESDSTGANLNLSFSMTLQSYKTN